MIEKILIWCVRLIYCFFKILPTQNKVTMISRQSNKKTADFELLEAKLKQMDSSLKVKVLCRELNGGIHAKLGEKIKYSFHCLKQMYNIATSKVVILDSYCILISILKHKKTLKVIQMWHSMGTMKKFGYQIIDKKEGSSSKMASNMRMHKNYDYVFASSKAYSAYLEEGFKCGMDKIRIYSLPRVDLLTDKIYKQKKRQEIINKYPQIGKKKNIVYCPTFRKDEKNLEKHLNELIKKVDANKYNLILKLHPLSKVEVNNEEIINDKIFSTLDMLFIADYIISDYSCVVYEAAILDIPLYFYAFDLQEYLSVRGLTFDYEKELPGIISNNIEIILEAIESNNYDYEALRKFREKYVENIENCTEKIANFVINLTKKIK